jgi:SAM-dependent methyltransferase
MVDSREEALNFPRGDLRLDFCHTCGFIQNSLFEPERLRYCAAYEETQGFSPHFMNFLRSLAADQVERFGLTNKSVLEIGCGKGEFLVLLCELGNNRGVGFDPSYRPERTQSAAAERIRFVRDLYSPKYADVKADYICCRHTLEHIGPVHQFVANIVDSMPRDSLVMFELPDMERILAEKAFWDIYYEHCSYFTRGSLARLFRSFGFSLIGLHKAYDDQYILIEGRRDAVPGAPHLPGEDDLAEAGRLVESFRSRVPEIIADLRADLERHLAAGRRVAIWGSGSKCVAYLHALGIADEVSLIVDINPHKHGKFLAGTGHRIVGAEALRETPPDVVIVMNHVYLGEIGAHLRSIGLTPELVGLK